MKKIKGYFINIINVIKPFLKRITIFMNLIYKLIKNFFKNILEIYKKLNNKSRGFEPIFILTVSCIFVLGFILFLKSFKSVEEVSLARNSAEALYYENKYDDAIKEYAKMQEEDEWPIYFAKIADLYSLRGEIEKSNNLLKEVIIRRDKIIKEKGYENIKDKDRELINSVILTFTLNKNYDDAISLGEDYIKEYGKDNKLVSTLFLAYLSNKEISNAKKIIEEYEYNNQNAYDLAYIANMKILTKNYDEGLELLKNAIDINQDELKIYDVIDTIYAFNKDKLIDSLIEKIENKNEYEYNIILAKAYSNSKLDVDKALDIINKLNLDNIDSIGTDIIKYNIYKNNNNKEYINYLKDAISKAEKIDKNSYATYYLLGVQALENNKFDDALSNVKKSISLNNSYLKSYSYLIPKIYIGKGNFDLIEGYYRTALEKEPFNYKLILDIADYYGNYESSDKAEYYYNLAINIKNDDATLYKKIAHLNIKDNKLEEAIDNLKKAIEIDEENGDYYRTLGALYLRSENYEEGIKFTRKAYEINNEDIKALNNASWYYLFVENNIERSYENIKSAFDDLKSSISEEDKSIIIENYNQVKRAYEREEKLEQYNLDNTLFNLIY